jgi:ribosome maturation factor RimP
MLAPQGAGPQPVNPMSKPEFCVADIARLSQVIEPEVTSLGFELVRVKMIGAEAGEGEPALQVMAEDPATGQLLIEQCAQLSRRISDRFDEIEVQGEVLVDGTYRLEVSSPGIDRPLTRPKDFVAWAGHEVRIAMAEPVTFGDGVARSTARGDLVAFEGDVITVEDRKFGRVQFPFTGVLSAKLVLTDRLIASTRPLDTSGAEEILEEEEG